MNNFNFVGNFNPELKKSIAKITREDSTNSSSYDHFYGTILENGIKEKGVVYSADSLFIGEFKDDDIYKGVKVWCPYSNDIAVFIGQFVDLKVHKGIYISKNDSNTSIYYGEFQDNIPKDRNAIFIYDNHQFLYCGEIDKKFKAGTIEWNTKERLFKFEKNPPENRTIIIEIKPNELNNSSNDIFWELSRDLIEELKNIISNLEKSIELFKSKKDQVLDFEKFELFYHEHCINFTNFEKRIITARDDYNKRIKLLLNNTTE